MKRLGACCFLVQDSLDDTEITKAEARPGINDAMRTDIILLTYGF